jgi:RNA polymerase sigma-70 factor (ECF subfamily)
VSEFDEHIREQIPRLRRYARALMGERSRADDLVQDTLERAWTRFHLWRRGSNLRAWLFTVMHNVFVNQHRGGPARGATVALDDTPEIAVRDGADASMQVRDLTRSLEQLPTEFREVLLLVGLEQMTYEEVAEILQIPLGTVMSRLARGRERLHALMSGQAPTLRRVK